MHFILSMGVSSPGAFSMDPGLTALLIWFLVPVAVFSIAESVLPKDFTSPPPFISKTNRDLGFVFIPSAPLTPRSVFQIPWYLVQLFFLVSRDMGLFH